MDKSMVSVVIPVYNEEAILNELVERCVKACDSMNRPYEVILVNDGSKDKSAKLICEAAEKHGGKIVGVLLNTNYGQHAAVNAGLEVSKGEYIITLDADLQNPPEEIPNLVATMDKGYDVVGTVRQNRQDTLFRRISSFMINTSVRKVTGVNMHDYGCMLRGYHRSVVNAMLQCHEHSKFIPILANSFAFNTTEIPVTHAERAVGDSKYSLWKLINLQFDLMTSMTTLPLRLLSVLGSCVCAFGFLLGLFIIVMRILKGDEWTQGGVFTLFAITFILMGGQFIAMGLLGEYIGRIFYNVRARPLYFIQRIVGRKQD